jgi:hypothetical protein
VQLSERVTACHRRWRGNHRYGGGGPPLQKIADPHEKARGIVVGEKRGRIEAEISGTPAGVRRDAGCFRKGTRTDGPGKDRGRRLS